MHDEPAPAQRHPPGDRLGQPERPDQVDLEHAREVLALGVEQQPQRRRAERARVVDQQVDRPDQRRRRARDAVDGLLGADVGGERVGLAARRADVRRRPLELVRARAPPAPPARPARASARPSAAPSPRLAPVTSTPRPRISIPSSCSPTVRPAPPSYAARLPMDWRMAIVLGHERRAGRSAWPATSGSCARRGA